MLLYVANNFLTVLLFEAFRQIDPFALICVDGVCMPYNVSIVSIILYQRSRKVKFH